MCTCWERPLCDWNNCAEYASWSVFNPFFVKYFPNGRFRFMCSQHEALFREAASKPMPGIHRPPYADDSWRPSLMDHIRLSCIAMRHEQMRHEQMKQPPQESPSFSRPWDHRYTPEQLKQVLWLRKMTWPLG